MTHPSPSLPKSSRRRWWIAPSVLVLGLYAGFFAFAVAQACTITTVIGRVDCVAHNQDGSYTAYFGYTNSYNGLSKEGVNTYNWIVSLPNHQHIAADDGDVLQQFPTGKHDYAFSVNFTGTQGIAWQEGLNSKNGQYEIAADAAAIQNYPCSPTIKETPPTQTINYGQQATFSAKVALPSPTNAQSDSHLPPTLSGAVIFTDSTCDKSASGAIIGNPQAISGGYSGIVSTNTKTLSVGTHTICATYSDKKYATISDSVTVLVNPIGATCGISAQPSSPSLINQPVTFTVLVGDGSGGVPTGKVDFIEDSASNIVESNAALSNGKTTFIATPTEMSLGSHVITASYKGDATHSGQTCTLTQVVNKIPTTTTVVSSQNPSVQGQGVTFTATVAPVSPNSCTLTGQVTFTIGTKTYTENVAGGQAVTPAIAISQLGANSVTANYSGDATCLPSNGSTTQTVGNVPPPPTGSNNSFIRIAQAASNSQTVDVAIDSATNFPNLSACTVGNYFPLSAGNHTLAISANGKALYSQTITFTAGDYYTIAFVDDTSATPVVTPNLVVFQDDLSVIPGKAKARVYHLSDSAGPVTVATNGTVVVSSLSFENASSYLAQSPSVENYVITPLSKSASPENVSINEAANQVYSLFLMCGDDAQTTGSGGIPTALPQTGFAPIIPGTNWNAIAFLMGALAIIGAGFGGVSGLAVVQYRRRHR